MEFNVYENDFMCKIRFLSMTFFPNDEKTFFKLFAKNIIQGVPEVTDPFNLLIIEKYER